jgi:nitrogen fixation-related uncharacterized protein
MSGGALAGSEITPRESGRLAVGLIVYGIVGLLLSIVAIVTVFWLNGQFDDTRGRLEVQVDALERTLAATSASLVEAADSADGFGQTLDESAPGLESAAAVMRRVESLLSTIGKLPFGLAPDSIHELAGELGTLSSALDGIAGSLAPNSAQLEETTASLRALATEVDGLTATLEDGVVEKGVDQGFDFLRAGIIALTVWLALPSLAALLIGIWLRRAVAPRELPTA